MIQVTKIITIVPFSTLSFNKRIGSPSGVVPRITLYPTRTAAKVAAACALLNPKIKVLSEAVNRKFFCANQAGINFDTVATTHMTTATHIVVRSYKNTWKLTNIPTPIRKNGINKAFPTNSIRFISADVFGIRRFNANPAKNAPIMASNPAASAKKEAKKTSPRTNINCPTRSSYRLKYQRPTKGNPQSTIKANTIVETPNWIQNPWVNSPVDIPTITANTNKASRQVITVPPIVTLIARFFVIPYLLTIGYVTNV